MNITYDLDVYEEERNEANEEFGKYMLNRFCVEGIIMSMKYYEISKIKISLLDKQLSIMKASIFVHTPNLKVKPVM